MGLTVGAVESVTLLGEALKESLQIDAPNFYYGISCPCCDSAAYYWYLRNVKSSNVTFSNIWVGTNFKTYAEQNCWMFDRKKISLDVDVVLTCYKRPQVLSQQLAAIKNQTLKPRRIFLYQDGIDDYYKVELNDKILSEFDACKISQTNGGVWKRFEFAEEICKSPYVCVFDDDTIPSERWFERRKNQVNLDRLFSFTRRNSIHVFFFDAYEELKPYLIKAGMKENVDFIDGRGLIIATID